MKFFNECSASCVRYLVSSLVKTVSIISVMYNPRSAVFFPIMLTQKRLRLVKVCKTIRAHDGRNLQCNDDCG